jgi:RNA polymerase sigma factor (TIGR02999 family)
MPDVTQILNRIEQGDHSVADELLELVYGELQKLARAKLQREHVENSLQATELVHEAYLRLVQSSTVSWQSRGHFFSAAAEAMRRILIERARRRKTEKHGGGRKRVELVPEPLFEESSPERLLALDEALEQLEQEDSTAAEIVKLRAFAGLSMEQVAQAVNLAPATVYRHWAYARAWLIAQVCELP